MERTSQPWALSIKIQWNLGQKKPQDSQCFLNLCNILHFTTVISSERNEIVWAQGPIWNCSSFVFSQVSHYPYPNIVHNRHQSNSCFCPSATASTDLREGLVWTRHRQRRTHLVNALMLFVCCLQIQFRLKIILFQKNILW